MLSLAAVWHAGVGCVQGASRATECGSSDFMLLLSLSLSAAITGIKNSKRPVKQAVAA